MGKFDLSRKLGGTLPPAFLWIFSIFEIKLIRSLVSYNNIPLVNIYPMGFLDYRFLFFSAVAKHIAAPPQVTASPKIIIKIAPVLMILLLIF